MKTKLTTLIIATAFSCSALAQTDLRPDWQKMGLHGSVKSIEQKLDGEANASYAFDDHGYITSNGETYAYNSNGQLMMGRIDGERFNIEYNSKGLMIEFSKGSYREAYTYDEQGNMKSCSTPDTQYSFSYNADGTINAKSDVFGNLLDTYEYDDKKNLVSKTTASQSGPSTKETWAYDKDGVAIKYTLVKSESGSSITESHTYVNDESGNWVKDSVETDSNGVKSTKVYTREIQYFGASRQLFLIK